MTIIIPNLANRFYNALLVTDKEDRDEIIALYDPKFFKWKDYILYVFKDESILGLQQDLKNRFFADNYDHLNYIFNYLQHNQR